MQTAVCIRIDIVSLEVYLAVSSSVVQMNKFIEQQSINLHVIKRSKSSVRIFEGGDETMV
jgi:hypothetical protein